MSENEDLFEAEQMLDVNPDTTVCFGTFAAVSQFGALLELDRVQTVMICAGGEKSFVSSGAFSSLMDVLGYLPLNVPRVENIPPEPDTVCVEKIVERMKEENPDVVAAVGGGSVMDAAKAAYLSWQSGIPVRELFGANAATRKFPGRTFRRTYCFPTTSGTGSEVTPYSNIIDAETGVKCIISDKAIIPACAFIEPDFTAKLPRRVTIDSALDAMVHCIESLLNRSAAKAHPENDSRAVHAVSMIVRALPEILNAEPGDMHGHARAELAAAACLGGMCIKDCPTSLPHLCSFSFCGKTTHGAAVAAMLPHFWRYYLRNGEVAETTMLLSGAFPGDSPEKVIDSCEEFIRASGIDTHPGDLSGTGRDFIDRLAEDAKLNPVKLASAPVPVSEESARKVFHEVLDSVWNGRTK